MRRTQVADELLRMVAFWQQANTIGKMDRRVDKFCSRLLSEVGALGFEIEDAEVWDRERKVWR